MFAEIDWLAAIKDVGFPIVSTCAIAWAVWATIRWIAGNLIVPARDRIFQLVDSFSGNVDRMSENLSTQTTTLQDINTHQREIRDTLKALADNGCGLHQCRNGVAPHK